MLGFSNGPEANANHCGEWKADRPGSPGLSLLTKARVASPPSTPEPYRVSPRHWERPAHVKGADGIRHESQMNRT